VTRAAAFPSCSRIARFGSADFVVARQERRLCSLRVDCSLRSLRLALFGRCLPHSLADEMHVCSLPRPGQRRASLAQHGGRAIIDARSLSASSGRQAELLAEQPAAALDERLGQRVESAGGRLVRTGLNQRNTRVTGSTELRIKRYLREQ
jgi:hypothetical protein